VTMTFRFCRVCANPIEPEHLSDADFVHARCRECRQLASYRVACEALSQARRGVDSPGQAGRRAVAR